MTVFERVCDKLADMEVALQSSLFDPAERQHLGSGAWVEVRSGWLSDADTLFVDTRHGPLHASVNLWPNQDSLHRLPLWRSLSSMLDDLASCLERNAPMAMRMSEWARYQPYIEDDRLTWEPVP